MAKLDGVYASVITDWDDVVELELRGARVDTEGIVQGEECCLVDDVNPDWFSVYARSKAGTSTCLCDLSAYDKAKNYLQALVLVYNKQVGVDSLQVDPLLGAADVSQYVEDTAVVECSNVSFMVVPGGHGLYGGILSDASLMRIWNIDNQEWDVIKWDAVGRLIYTGETED